MNVEIKATKSNKEKGDKKEYGMIPRMRTLRIGEVIFPTATTLNRANTERMKRILNRSKYTRIFQETNKELLQIIKDLNPRLTQKEIKGLLTKYEEFEQPKEMAIALEEEVSKMKKLVVRKNKDIEDINKQTKKRLTLLNGEYELKTKELQMLNEEYKLKTKEIKKESREKIKDIKKDVQELQAEIKKLLARAEKYKKIKYDRK